MKTILYSLFGRAETGSSLPPAGANSVHAARPNTATTEITLHRQLVEKLLVNLLRRSGIPADWVEAQMLVLSSRTRGNGAHLRLVLKHGDEQLLKYIFALQKQLQKDIHDADSHAAQWLQGISWQLEIDDSCQRTELPEKSFWQPVIEAQDLKNASRKLSVAKDAKPQPAAAEVTHKVTASAPVTSLSAGIAAVADPQAAQAPTVAALQALRQLREARALATSPTPSTVPTLPIAPITPTSNDSQRNPAVDSIAAVPATAQPLVAVATPIKPHKPPSIDKPRLDYGAPNFECSRAAEETELTPDLAALFALDESQWKTQVTQAAKA